MITGIVVLASVVFAAIFSVAWLVRPNLRTWIEEPKYRFQESVQNYDNTRRGRS